MTCEPINNWGGHPIKCMFNCSLKHGGYHSVWTKFSASLELIPKAWQRHFTGRRFQPLCKIYKRFWSINQPSQTTGKKVWNYQPAWGYQPAFIEKLIFGYHYSAITRYIYIYIYDHDTPRCDIPIANKCLYPTLPGSRLVTHHLHGIHPWLITTSNNNGLAMVEALSIINDCYLIFISNY